MQLSCELGSPNFALAMNLGSGFRKSTLVPLPPQNRRIIIRLYLTGLLMRA